MPNVWPNVEISSERDKPKWRARTAIHNTGFMYPVRRTSHIKIILHHPSPLYQHRMIVIAHVEAVVIRVLVR